MIFRFGLIVFALFVAGLSCAYLYSQSVLSDIEQRYPASGRFVNISGTQIHYTDNAAMIGGQGVPIVLLHGASTSLMDYEASIAPPLRRTNRVVALDRPGYGYSERPSGPWVDPRQQADLVVGLLDNLGIQRAVVVGHSLGGAVTMALAVHHPERLAGLVLLGGVSHPWKSGVAWTNHLAGIPLLGTLFGHTLLVPSAVVVMPEAIEEVFAPNSVPERYIERTHLELSISPKAWQSSAQDLRLLSPYLEVQKERYGELKMPILLITGADDTVVPAWNHSERLERLLSQVRLVSLAETGHAPHHVRTDQVVALIKDFVDERALRTPEVQIPKVE